MSKFDEVIFLNLGQAGIQIGSALWELLCIEHGIGPDGTPLDTKEHTEEGNNIYSIFNISNTGNYVPRAIYVDSEPSVIDEIKTGAYKDLYSKQLLISEKEDAANNYARGSYTVGRQMIRIVNDVIRKLVEQTDHLRSFFFFNSSGGGTGSGLTPLIFLSLLKDYTKIIRNNFSIVPGSNFHSAIVEPYNVSLQHFASADTVDINFMFENESLFEICGKKLFLNSPSFSDLNRILAMVINCISIPLRYSTILRSTIDDMVTNLVPYPKIHYPIVRVAPLNHVSRLTYEKISTYELTKEIFTKSSQSVKINTKKGLFIAVVLSYQGLVQSKEIYKYIDEVRMDRGNKFVEWSPAGYKVGICRQIPSVPPMIQVSPSDQYATMLLNSTAISEFFKSLSRKFDILYKKKSFVYWYLDEGMEEIEFTEARNEIKLLIGDLKEISMNEKELEEYMNSSEPAKSRFCSVRKESFNKSN